MRIECCRPHADLQCWMDALVGAAVHEEGSRVRGWKIDDIDRRRMVRRRDDAEATYAHVGSATVGLPTRIARSWSNTRCWSTCGPRRRIIGPWLPCRFRPNLTTISRTRSKSTGYCSECGLRRSITMPSAVARFHGGAPLHTVQLQWQTVAVGNSL